MTAIYLVRAHRLTHVLAFLPQLTEHESGDHGLARAGHAIEQHVRRDVAVEGIDEIANQSLDLAIPVWQMRGFESVVEGFSVEEEGILSENLLENISVHFFSPSRHATTYSPMVVGMTVSAANADTSRQRQG